MDAISLGLDLLAQAAPAGAVDVAGPIPSVWDFIVRGGVRLAPLFVCSLVALAIIIERFVSLRRRRVVPPEFVARLQPLLPAATGDPTRALDFCRASAAPVARVFAAALRHLRDPLERLEKHVEEAGQREVVRLRKYLRALAVISSVSVLLGLLGTVFGMITAFQTVARSAESLGKTELLAKGVYEALIATAMGLLVAIPTLILYHYFSSRVEALVGEIERVVSEFIEQATHAPIATATLPRESLVVPAPVAPTLPPSVPLAPAASVAASAPLVAAS